MTGPEHYREAEDILNQPWQDETHARLFIAQAQVHATLALAAATALNLPHPDPDSGLPRADWDAWTEAASAYKRPGRQATA